MSCSVLFTGTAFVLLPMPETVKIIRAGLDDAMGILELSRKTFIETYYEVSDKSTVLKYLDTHITLQKILLDLQNPSILFYIARKGIQNIGFLKLFEDKIPKGIAGKKCLMLDKLYVLQEFHGKSIGTELMQIAKNHAKGEGFQVIWLQVWQKNIRAIQFYQNAGFVVYETSLFDYYEEPEHDFLLRYDLYN
jgi:ribosomal protein S18 acetylase RimI-like enzyme